MATTELRWRPTPHVPVLKGVQQSHCLFAVDDDLDQGADHWTVQIVAAGKQLVDDLTPPGRKSWPVDGRIRRTEAVGVVATGASRPQRPKHHVMHFVFESRLHHRDGILWHLRARARISLDDKTFQGVDERHHDGVSRPVPLACSDVANPEPNWFDAG